MTSRSFSSGATDVIAEMEAAGFQVVMGAPEHSLADIGEDLAEAEGWIAGTGTIHRDHLNVAPKLKIIARYGVGVDAVDIACAHSKNIVVTNTPGANSDAVADLTLALMLEGVRHITVGSANLRAGNRAAVPGRELGELSIGIIGFGRIGQGVARRLSGFGSTVRAHDPFADASVFSAHGVAAADLTTIFAESDVITLHAPGGQVLIDAAALRHVRPNAVIVNTARADLVDEYAIADALRTTRLGAYVSDVLQADPPGEPNPLLATDIADRVTLTPHIAAHTVHAIDRMGSMAWANIRAVLNDEEPLHPVHPSGKGPHA